MNQRFPKHDSLKNAEYLLERIEAIILELTELPERDIRDYRERFFKPYRIIYRPVAKKVHVMVIADGRRDMKSLLERRLIAG